MPMEPTGVGAASSGEGGLWAQPACTNRERRTNPVSAGRRRGLFLIRGRPPCRDGKADVPGKHDAATVTLIDAPRPPPPPVVSPSYNITVPCSEALLRFNGPPVSDRHNEPTGLVL